ncbi:TPR domain protein, putative component of TonB system [Pseudoalteromonas luteoviolacea B = ATCC 29581]|nr:TPR domain protein, putative component of TonB system [Pseudoalteromonas luteoviolacea B = ATCC 29581]
MKHLSKATALALLLSISGAALTAPAVAAPNYAEIEKRKKAKTKIMGERVGKKVVKAFELYNEDKVDEAIAILREIEASDDYDAATVNRYLGQLLAQKEKMKDALKYIELAIKPDALNFKDQADTMKLYGDLLSSQERFQDAIKAYTNWMDFTGEEDAKVYALLANSYFQLQNYNQVIVNADKAIAMSKEKPVKDYYQLKVGAYFELKQYKNLVSVAETMVKVFPADPKVWTNLGRFYMQTEEFSKGLTTMQVAYDKGYIESETDYKVLASFYSLVDVPYKAAVYYEKFIKADKVKRNKQNVSALASYYHAAKHIKEAAKYYEEAAAFDNDADLYRRAGSLLVELQNYPAAIERLNKALELGSDKKGSIYSSLAEAYLYQEKYKQAYDAIVKAQDDPSTAKFAKSWASFIKDKAQRKGVSLK